MIAIIILGLCFNIALFFSLNLDNQDSYKGTVEIISLGENKGAKVKYVCVLDYNKRLLLYDSYESSFMPGDIVYIEGKIDFAEEVRNYKGFNQKKYFFQDKVYGSITPLKIKKINVKKDMYYFIGIIKKSFYQVVDDNYEDINGNFLKGLLFGDKNSIEEDIIEEFRKSSMSHILAISGIHISYIVTTINTILHKITIHKREKGIITICVLIFFWIFTGMSPSCTRACIMYILSIIGDLLHRKNNNYILLAASFLIIIFLNFYDIYSVGLWLSCMATLGIMLYAKFISRLLSIKLKRYSNLMFNYIIECLSVSIGAQIMIVPIALYSFNTISFSFFIPNILTSILLGPIIILGYLSVILGFIFSQISRIISFIETILINIIFGIVKWSSKLPFSLVYLTTPSFFTVILYYVFVFWIIILYKCNYYRILRIILNKKRRGLDKKV